MSDLSSCKSATPPKADASSDSCTKQVRVEEARESPDGQFFSSHVSPLQRRRSHSYSSDDAIQRQRGRLRSLTLPPPSSRDTPKSPSKKRLFGFFQRSSSDHMCVCVCVCVCLPVCLCVYAASNVHSANTLEWMPPSCSVHVLGVSRPLCVIYGPHQPFHCVCMLRITHSCAPIASNGLWWDTSVLAVVLWCV